MQQIMKYKRSRELSQRKKKTGYRSHQSLLRILQPNLWIETSGSVWKVIDLRQMTN